MASIKEGPTSTAEFPFPNEILKLMMIASREIGGTKALCNLARVSRRWSRIATAILYSDVRLTLDQVPVWTSRITATYKPLVRTLSILVRLNTELPRTSEERFYPHLASLVRELPALVCFSFIVRGTILSEPDISLDDLEFVVRALPTSCIHLEIDTRFYDRVPSFSTNNNHLCLAIQSVLPRLKSVRLACRHICSGIFGAGTRLPNLQEMCIDFIGHPTPMSCHNPTSETAFDCLSLTVQDLVARGDVFAPGAKVFLNFAIRSPYSTVQEKYVTCVAVEMISKVARAYPIRQVALWDDAYSDFVSWVPYAIRLENGDDVFINAPEVDRNDVFFFIQGGVWRELTTGHRFPKSLLESRRRLSLGFTTPERQYHASLRPHQFLSRVYTSHWSEALLRRETRCGMILLRAETRVGPDAYLSRELISEDVPPGWTRVDNDLVQNPEYE